MEGLCVSFSFNGRWPWLSKDILLLLQRKSWENLSETWADQDWKKTPKLQQFIWSILPVRNTTDCPAQCSKLCCTRHRFAVQRTKANGMTPNLPSSWSPLKKLILCCTIFQQVWRKFLFLISHASGIRKTLAFERRNEGVCGNFLAKRNFFICRYKLFASPSGVVHLALPGSGASRAFLRVAPLSKRAAAFSSRRFSPRSDSKQLTHNDERAALQKPNVQELSLS